MKAYSEFFQEACEKIGYSQEATNTFFEVAKKIDADPDFHEKFFKIRRYFMFPKPVKVLKTLERLTELAEAKDVHPYTLHTVFFTVCSELLRKRYLKAGFTDEYFWEMIKDLGYKAAECKDVKGIDGTFVGSWNIRWFNLTRFTLGRFQYEDNVMPVDYVGKNGVLYPKGMKCIHIHIPSSGVPLTEEVRMDSYRKAYEFFKDYLVDGVLVLHCYCWMLNPDHDKFLPETSNIIGFKNDFDIYKSQEFEDFSDGERIFGAAWYGPTKDLPEKTGLQRAYKKWLLDGNLPGKGWGVILFDGEKIIR